MEYQIDKQGLLDRISAWDSFLKRKVHLIACGGTALTLLGVKASTKDIDLMVPNLNEYEYLIAILKQLGYKSASGWGWKREVRFRETASFDVSEDKVNKNFEHFLKILRREGLINEK